MLTVTAEGQTVSDEVTVSIVTSAPEVHADDGQLPFDPVDATDALQRAIGFRRANRRCSVYGPAVDRTPAETA